MAMSAGRAILRMGLLFLAAAALTAPVPGQERKVRKCASDDRYQAMLQRDPEFRAARKQLRVLTEAFEAVRESGRFGERTGPVRIPVVVHVVYHTDAQNISDEQIKSQLAALAQFALAVRGPDGNATPGITRTKSAETEFLYDGPKGEAVKFTARGGHDGWPRDSYLNLWVCPLGGDLLGYASFPGEDPGLDGVVINYTAFGTTGTAETPFDKGRTATHEIGHWLNLFHIWGDDRAACTGSDQVRDTPNQASQNTQCPSFPHRTCGNKGTGDMFMNYMDYTDDACMFAFTKGQVRRMEATLNGARLAITTSQGLTVP